MYLDKTSEYLRKAVYPVSRMVNGAGVGVLAVMMVLTAADVILRYVFNRPITGVYELTQLMMAIVVAFGLGYTGVNKGHISVDLIISRLRPRTQAVVNIITSFLSLVIFMLITWQSVVYAETQRQSHLSTAQLFIPVYPFIYAVAFGSALLCLVAINNLFEYLAQAIKGARWQTQTGLFLLVIVVLLIFSLAVWPEGMKEQVSAVTMGYIGIAVLVAILFSGMAIGVVMALVGFLGFAYITGTGPALVSIGTTPYGTSSTYSLSIIPLFVLMGAFCFHSGLSKDLYYSMYKWLGHLPGGLAMATVAGCAGFAAVSGSTVATTVTMGTVALPEMRRYKYDPSLATGCIAAGGSIGILIPPSIIMVIYCILTEQSIGKLFLAGFIPGILQALFYMVTIYILCRRNPSMGPQAEKSSIAEKFVSLKGTWGVITLFILVIGGLYLGVFTPTEAAGIGAFGAMLFALGRRKLSWRGFTGSLLETGKTTAMCLLILIGANILGYFLAISRLPTELSDFVSGLEVSRLVVLGIIILVYLFLGAITSSLAMIILTVPIFFPVIMNLGFDPIWFGIIIVRVVEIGGITPPVGINVFVLKGVAKDVPMYTIFRGIVPFLIADFLHMILIILVPQVALLLPGLMK